VLIFHERLYRSDLAPTISGGGTVNYVWADGQDYVQDIEIREKAGTPGILQTLRAGLAMELKQRLDPKRIGEREADLMRRAMDRLSRHPAIEIIGPKDPDVRTAIISFNVRVKDSFLHPRYVTVLLNDLFGIQSRAGCSCAGPYGHRLLRLDSVQTQALRRRISTGVVGLRPGWVRVNFHYLMTDEEFDFLCDAVLFAADRGRDFLPVYKFDVRTGGWCHESLAGEGSPSVMALAAGVEDVSVGLDAALNMAETDGSAQDTSAHDTSPRVDLYSRYLTEARDAADALRNAHGQEILRTTERDLIPFVYLEREKR
jgi:hypothetical protein